MELYVSYTKFIVYLPFDFFLGFITLIQLSLPLLVNKQKPRKVIDETILLNFRKSPHIAQSALFAGAVFTMSMNIFRLAGDMSHVFSIIVLLLRLRVAKNAQGTKLAKSREHWTFGC